MGRRNVLIEGAGGPDPGSVDSYGIEFFTCVTSLGDVVRDVVVEREPHAGPGAICRAIRTSISPRWSS